MRELLAGVGARVKIHRVTFTGADETADVSALLDFAEEFGFVEFGILFSSKRQGLEPRYPKLEWVNDLAERGHRLKLSAHACGGLARSMVGCPDEAEMWFDTWAGAFDRIQINGADVPAQHDAIASVAQINASPTFIVQCGDRNALDAAKTIAEQAGNVVALFDASGGRGASPLEWPAPPPGLRVGYAGGIGPNNVDDVLDQLERIDGPPTWIDMESRVRSPDLAAFDLSLCRKVAHAVARRRWP